MAAVAEKSFAVVVNWTGPGEVVVTIFVELANWTVVGPGLVMSAETCSLNSCFSLISILYLMAYGLWLITMAMIEQLPFPQIVSIQSRSS